MEQKNKIKFRRNTWKNDSSPDESQVNFTEKQKEIKNNSDDCISIEINGYRYMDKETGFVIAFGRLVSKPVGLPDKWLLRLDKNKIILKGASLSLTDLNTVGSIVDFHGDWIIDPKFGLQYKFDWTREALPTSIEALTAYLSSRRIKGIGPSLAKKIIDKWGMETLDILNKNPEKLEEISGMTKNKIKTVKEEWEKKKYSYELVSFFGLYGIGEIWVPKIIDKLGEKGIKSRIKENPYILTQVDGIGFSTADKIALSIGIDKKSPKRTEAVLTHVLNEYINKMGHTACPTGEWFKEASNQLGLSMDELQPIAQKLINNRSIVLRNIQVPINKESNKIMPCVSTRKEYGYERTIALNIKRIIKNKKITQYEKMSIYKGVVDRSDSLDASQLESVKGIFENKISVLTGGPGTGKTTTLKSIVDISEKMKWKIVLAAPTGRAAKRMEEAIGKSASTIHRALKFNPKDGFFYNKDNQMEGDLFIVDESSMLDNYMGSHWVQAIPDHAKVIFVGDVDQLPSVGPGNFLKDLIHTNVAKVFRLNYIHRQAEGSLIAESAKNILNSKFPIDKFDYQNDFSWVIPEKSVKSHQTNEFMLNSILSLVDNLLKKGYKKNDIQIISPQKDGLTGVNNLNDILRFKLNESKPNYISSNEFKDNAFNLGDRLLVNKNNYEKNIFNGDMGVIKKIDNEDGSIELKMENGDLVLLEGKERNILTLGYAITVHKSQGGERPVIIFPCSPSHTYSMNKNLIYTGITRGKDKVFLLSTKKTLNIILRKEDNAYRITGLKEEIKNIFKINKKLNNSPFKRK